MSALCVENIKKSVRKAGFVPFCWLTPAPGELPVNTGETDQPKSLLLIGNAGPEMWDRYQAERQKHRVSLDQWCRKQIGALAASLEAQALFPFEAPPLPFQRWAIRSGVFHSSRIGLTIHNEFGLWHGFRGALLFDKQVSDANMVPTPHPCETCAEKPCLSSCPVGAFLPAGYNVPACVSHLNSADRKNCSGMGCAARRACPVGGDYYYGPEQAAFHMSAFKRAFE